MAYEEIFRRGQRNNLFDFDGGLDHRLEPTFLLVVPQNVHPLQKSALSESILVNYINFASDMEVSGQLLKKVGKKALI